VDYVPQTQQHALSVRLVFICQLEAVWRLQLTTALLHPQQLHVQPVMMVITSAPISFAICVSQLAASAPANICALAAKQDTISSDRATVTATPVTVKQWILMQMCVLLATMVMSYIRVSANNAQSTQEQ
jgi:hypothetical protein